MSGETSGDRTLTIDALHQFAYCPRRAFLMHVEGLMAHNAFTEDGRRIHRRVDAVEQVLDRPTTRSLDTGVQGEDRPEIVRSVTLTSDRLALTGKLDLVSIADGEAVPVETKRGQVPQTAQHSWEPERVQVMAQGLLLREHGWHCDHGYLYFAGSRRKVDVPFTPELEARTLELIDRAKQQWADVRIPGPLEDSPKCNGCSLAGICLPDETLALRHAPPDPVAPTVRRLYPPRSDATPLYVQQQGAWVGIRKGNLVVRRDDETLAETHLKDLDHLVLCGNVQISTQTLHSLCESGIGVCHLSSGHWFYGFTTGFALRNAFERAAQFRTADQPARCLEFAKAVTRAKIANQRTMLLRNALPRPQEAIDGIAAVQRMIDEAVDFESVLGIEGIAARHYFGALPAMIKARELAERFQANGRGRRPPPDPVNACLSFGYALLVKECTVALAAVGLDPHWGLHHRPRHGRPALALDLMEEFRPLIVDSAAISAFNTEMLRLSDFTVGSSGCLLRDAGRKAFIRAFELRMDQMVTHPVLDYRLSWRVMVRLQARLLARWLRGDIASYPGMVTR